MTRQDWDKLSPAAAKRLVSPIGRASHTAEQWVKSMHEVVPGTPAMTTLTQSDTSLVGGQWSEYINPCWEGMWMAFHRGKVISGSAR